MSEFTTWKIEPHPDGWVVRRHDRAGCESRHERKHGAIRTAELLATEDPPSQVLVHDTQGSITAAVHYNDTGRDPSMPEGTLAEPGELNGSLTGLQTPAPPAKGT